VKGEFDMMHRLKRGRRREQGHAVIEVALMSPWIFFLFMGALDFGFYAYAIIATQNAARVAVMQTSLNSTTAANSTLACQYALTELNKLPNASSLGTCGALPVTVNATSVVDADGANASQVAVTYQTINMIPIPGLTGRLTLTRTAQMRLKGP
jgi:Flp pilus assembly protein TadG